MNSALTAASTLTGQQILNNIITYILNPIIFVIIALAVIYFLVGVFIFVKNAENSEKRIEGAKHIMWSVLGIAIMFSVFMIVSVIRNTIGEDSVNKTASLKRS